MTWEEKKKRKRLSEFMRLRAVRQSIIDKGDLTLAERSQVRKCSNMMARISDYLTARDIFDEIAKQQ
jgi:hypothetical protein